MEEENVVVDNSNTTEEVTPEVTPEETGDETSELHNELAKAKELATNYKIRAEKAEKLAKEIKFSEPKAKTLITGELSTKDLYALMEAKVSQEDVDEVVEYAKFKNIPVSEALKSNTVKSILSEKAEQRQTASAANVGSSKRGSGKVSDETLLDKASKGELPDNDADLIRLIKARRGIKN